MLSLSDPRELGFLPDRLERINAHIQSKYLDTGKLPHAALLIGRGDEIAHLWHSAVADDAIFRIMSMTKPITSIALMQLVEQGRIALSDPIAKYIPEFNDLGVFVAGGGTTPFITRPPTTAPRVIDLMRHTAGFTYGFQERSNIDAAYRKDEVDHWAKHDNDEFVAKLARIPLEFDPGPSWNYSVATDLCGIIVSRISGMPLGDYFAANILGPLGMNDTGFVVDADQAHRIPAAYSWHPTEKMKLSDKAGAESAWTRQHKFQSGGGGLASTLADYHRFCRMLLNGGALDGVNVLKAETVTLMGQNHIGAVSVPALKSALPRSADFTFIADGRDKWGLGFLITTDQVAGKRSPGSLSWGGINNTFFWIDPARGIAGVIMMQYLPFADAKALAVYDTFERGTYQLVNAER